MTWQKEIDELNRRRELLAEGFDPIRLARAQAQDKMRIRDRVKYLADPGSFRPHGGLSGQTKRDEDGNVTSMMPSGSLTGRCTINGRRVVITGHESTVRHDSSGGESGYHRRITGLAENFAFRNRAPLIRILDAPGANIRSYEAAGRPEVVWASWADGSSELLPLVPVIAIVAGAAAGLPAIDTCMGHFNVIVRGNGQSFPGGPPVVKVALGRDVTKEELGGADLLAPIGVIDNIAENEREAFDIVKRFLGYLPESAWEMPPVEAAAGPSGGSNSLVSAVSKEEPRDYDPNAIIESVVDAASLFEIAPLAGPECVTALARVGGYPCGIIAKNPRSENRGALGIIASEKVARLIELCDTFHLPVVALVDEPGAQGFTAPAGPEAGRIIRARARLIQAIYDSSTPWISFTIGRAHAIAGSFARRPNGFHRHYAWPSGSWHAPDAEGRERPIYSILERFGIDDVIDPRDTRRLLTEFLEESQAVIRTQLGPVQDRGLYRL